MVYALYARVQLQYAQDQLKAVRADVVDRDSQISRLRIETAEANERAQRSSAVCRSSTNVFRNLLLSSFGVCTVNVSFGFLEYE